MIKTPLKVGIVGTGRFGSRHLEKWLKIEDIELIGFNDKDDGTCGEVADKFGLPCFPLEELIGSVDILDIVVPISSHFKIAKKALEAGKHIFVEKSFTEFPDQADELKELAVKSSLMVGIGHIERFNPVLVELKKHLTAIPSKLMAFRQGPFIPGVGLDVSIIKELMIHDIDLILSFVNEQVRDVKAVGIPILTPKVDIANARLEFENGCVANLTASRVSRERTRKFRVFQLNDYISLDFQNRNVEMFSLEETADGKRQIVARDPDISEGEPLKLELEAFLATIRGESIPGVCTGYQGKKSLELALQIVEQTRNSSGVRS